MGQNVNVNLTPGGYPREFHVSQYDVGRQLVAKVVDSTGDYSIPSGATVVLVGTKPSGFGFTLNGTVSGSTVTFSTTATVTAEYGRIPCEIRITNGSTILGTANCMLAVEMSPHPEGTTDGNSETVIPELTLLVERIEAAAESIHDLSVSATTLAAGSDATANYDAEENSINFGIPRGADGEVSQAELDAAVSDLKSDLENLSSKNYYGIAPKTKNKIINADGTLSDNTYADVLTYVRPDNALKVTAYNGITVGGVLYQSASLLAFYDNANQFISFFNGQSYPTGLVTIFIPDNAYYIKVVQSNESADASNVFVGFDVELRDIVNSIKRDYLNEEHLIVGKYITNTGAEVADGAHNFWYTDYIDIPYKGYISYKGIGLNTVSIISFYDSTKTFVSSVTGIDFDSYAEGACPIPVNAKYMRFCTLKNSSYTSLDVDDITFLFTAFEPIGHIKVEFDGITWLAIGDSITYGDTVNGYAYPNYIADSTAITLSKEGHSGYSMEALYNMRSSFIASCDIATVFAGTNDFNSDKALGTINDNTTSTFYGVVNLMMQYMQTTYNDAPVVFFTPIWRNYSGSQSGVIVGMVNNNGDNLLDFAEAIIKCGKKHGVPVVDLSNNSGIGEYNLTGLTNDGVHPNAIGQQLLAGIFKSALHKYVDYLA